MPYVAQERRPALDKVVDELVISKLKADHIEIFLINLTKRGCFDETGFEIRPFNPFSDNLSNALREAIRADVKPSGDINYILFKYCKYHVKPSYNNYKDFMGEIYNAINSVSIEFRNEFREAAEWIRIKILTPYEEKTIEKNGDI